MTIGACDRLIFMLAAAGCGIRSLGCRVPGSGRLCPGGTGGPRTGRPPQEGTMFPTLPGFRPAIPAWA
jgi:hypothetical protein